MFVKEIKSPLLKIKINNHKKNKQKLLQLIKQTINLVLIKNQFVMPKTYNFPDIQA